MDEACNDPAMIIEVDRRKDVSMSQEDIQRDGMKRWVVIYKKSVSYVSPELCSLFYSIFNKNERTLFG
jgi:hypothetical protein